MFLVKVFLTDETVVLLLSLKTWVLSEDDLSGKNGCLTHQEELS